MRDVTRAELERAGQEDTALGLVVLLVARRLDEAPPTEKGTSVAAMLKAYREALAAALADAEPVMQDPLAAIRRNAALKLVPPG